VQLASLERLKYVGCWPRQLLDVGAHVGGFARAFRERFPGCDVELVEANPHCEPHLRATGFPYHLVAASDRRGQAEFHLTRENLLSTGSSLYPEQTSHFASDRLERVAVELVPLDELFPERSFDFVKIDVQGAELDVIRGARRLLSAAEHVLIELSLMEYNRGGALADAVVAGMDELGFRVEEVLEYHRSPDVLDGAIFQMDFLFAPRWPAPGQRVLQAPWQSREPVLAFLRREKARSAAFRVLDVGAAANPWSAEVADATFDKSAQGAAPQSFLGDLNKEADWQPLLERVARRGRFAYAVCTHTLEDLAYPAVALKYLPLVAEAGFIAVPSAHTELTRIEGPYRGFIHHRWLAVPDPSGRLVFCPKLSLLERMAGGAQGETTPALTEWQLFWHGGIDYRILNDDYLGPSPAAVTDMYQAILDSLAAA